MISSSSTPLGPKPNDKRPYKKEDMDRRGGSDMTMVAEIGVMPEPRRGKEGFHLKPSEGAWPHQPFNFVFQPPEL